MTFDFSVMIARPAAQTRRTIIGIVGVLVLASGCSGDGSSTDAGSEPPTSAEASASVTSSELLAESERADEVSSAPADASSPPVDTGTDDATGTDDTVGADTSDGGGVASGTGPTEADPPGREEIVENLLAAGMSEDGANCVVDDLQEEFGSDVFDAAEPPDGFDARLSEVAADCVVAVSADDDG